MKKTRILEEFKSSKILKDYYPLLFVLPITIGGIVQVIQLSNISIVFLQFFSATQMLKDGLIILSYCAIGLIFPLLFRLFFKLRTAIVYGSLATIILSTYLAYLKFWYHAYQQILGRNFLNVFNEDLYLKLGFIVYLILPISVLILLPVWKKDDRAIISIFLLGILTAGYNIYTPRFFRYRLPTTERVFEVYSGNEFYLDKYVATDPILKDAKEFSRKVLYLNDEYIILEIREYEDWKKVDREIVVYPADILFGQDLRNVLDKPSDSIKQYHLMYRYK